MFEERFLIGSLAFFSVCRIAYICQTKFTNQIIVQDKYQRLSDGTGIYMVVDSNNNHYCIKRSLLFWSFYPAEKWQSLKQGKCYNVTGYGIRNGFFHIYPTIVNIQ